MADGPRSTVQVEFTRGGAVQYACSTFAGACGADPLGDLRRLLCTLMHYAQATWAALRACDRACSLSRWTRLLARTLARTRLHPVLTATTALTAA